jgi:hypothetical protein
VDQRAGDFEPTHLPTGEIADLVVDAVGKGELFQDMGSTRACPASAYPVQCGVVEQALAYRQVEIERAGLEHDAKSGQRCGSLPPDVKAEDLDRAGRTVVEACHERKQGCLAGAVQTQQGGE